MEIRTTGQEVSAKHHPMSARRQRQERRAIELHAAREFGDIPKPGNHKKPKVKFRRRIKEAPPSLPREAKQVYFRAKPFVARQSVRI